jgi:hypothetical protein
MSSERFFRTLGCTATGAGLGLLFTTFFQPFFPQYALVLVVGSIVGGVFGYISWRDPTLANAQDPPVTDRPPD